MSLLHELEAHAERIAAANRRVREVDLEVRAAAARVEEVRNQVIEAHAEGDDAAAAKLGKALAAAEVAAKRLRDEKLVGVQRGVARAEADRVQFVSANYAGLLEERRPKAREVAESVENALAELVQAHAAWLSVEGEVMALMRLAGRGHERTPAFPAQLGNVIRDVQRLGAPDVPAPVPVLEQPNPRVHEQPRNDHLHTGLA